MMITEIQFVKMDVSDTLTTYIHDKIDPLATKYPWLIKAQVFIKKIHDRTGMKSIFEIEMSIPSPRIYASSTE